MTQNHSMLGVYYITRYNVSMFAYYSYSYITGYQFCA